MKMGILGAGMMGSEIALTFAMAGHPTLITDNDPKALESVIDRLTVTLDKLIKRGLATEAAKETALKNLFPTQNLNDYADRDMVIEAVFENIDVKSETFARLDAILAPDCIVCSNTSTLPISQLAAAVSESRRGHFLGTHFFSPVSRMALVEVIPQFDTTPEILDRVMDILSDVGKTPIRVKDVAGFAVNRLLHALMIEAVRLVEEGVCTAEDIDTACRLGLGHPVGPMELSDVVSNKLCLEVQEILQESYGERFRPRPLLKQMVAAGRHGRKVNKGWRC